MNKIKRTRADAAFDALNIALLAILTVILLYPLYFVLIASVSDPYAIAQGSVKLIPVRPTLEAYQNIMKDTRIWLGYRNTIIYTVLGTLLSLALTIPSAYVLSKKDLPGRAILMTFCLITMYFGGGLIPTYLIVKKVGLLNRAYTLIVLGSVSVYNIIVTRSFFQSTLPDSLFESARIDGAGEMKQLQYITMPAVWLQLTFMVVSIFYQSLGGNFGLVNVILPSAALDENGMVMGLYVYRYGTSLYKVGFSYAASIVMLIVTSIISLTVKFLMDKAGEKL